MIRRKRNVSCTVAVERVSNDTLAIVIGTLVNKFYIQIRRKRSVYFLQPADDSGLGRQSDAIRHCGKFVFRLVLIRKLRRVAYAASVKHFAHAVEKIPFHFVRRIPVQLVERVFRVYPFCDVILSYIGEAGYMRSRADDRIIASSILRLLTWV